MLVLALAYGVFEEGITTESLFDPGYAHAHLLDRGFIPALGIGVPWTLFVLALHTVWSISVPIALVEGLTPARRTTPWLRTKGLVVAAVLFVVGSAFTVATSYAMDHFRAPWLSLGAVIVVVVALVVSALRLPRERVVSASAAPSPWWVFVLTLVAGAVFMFGFALPTWLAVAAMAVAFVATAWAALAWSRRAGWDGRHRLALAGAALLTYAWHGLLMRPLLGDDPVLTPVSHAVFAAAAVLLLAFEVRRLRPTAPLRVPGQLQGVPPA
jgi:hypothetical protein